MVDRRKELRWESAGVKEDESLIVAKTSGVTITSVGDVNMAIPFYLFSLTAWEKISANNESKRIVLAQPGPQKNGTIKAGLFVNQYRNLSIYLSIYLSIR